MSPMPMPDKPATNMGVKMRGDMPETKGVKEMPPEAASLPEASTLRGFRDAVFPRVAPGRIAQSCKAKQHHRPCRRLWNGHAHA